MRRSNFHTHCTYCDGKNTPRELIEKAIELGCPQLGFSSHGYMGLHDQFAAEMTLEQTVAYKREIRALQKEYADRIQIFLGIEKDYYNKDFSKDYDYVIGSVHSIYKDGEYLQVDLSRDNQIENVEKHYNGDFYAYIEDYYEKVGEIDTVTGCDIVGHFDLITKFNENHDLFDTNNERYIAAADRALDKLMNKGLVFEINYGAIARGYRKTPYPEPRILDRLIANGEKTLKNSDCHRKEYLLLGIDCDNYFEPKKK